MRDDSKQELQSELATVLSHMVWGSSHVALRFSATPTFDNRQETADFLRKCGWRVFDWKWLREIATGKNGLDSLAAATFVCFEFKSDEKDGPVFPWSLTRMKIELRDGPDFKSVTFRYVDNARRREKFKPTRGFPVVKKFKRPSTHKTMLVYFPN